MPTQDDFAQDIDLISLTDAPDMPGAIAALANGVIPRSVMRFASASARGAAITAPVEGMPSYLMDVNRLEIYDGSAWATPPQTLTSTATGLSAASGFSVNTFAAYREGRVIAVDIYLARTGATINESSGNINDTECCTLPANWRPTHQTINGTWDSGVAGGGFVVGTDGVCTLRSASGDINNGSNLRMHVVFIKTT